MWLLLIFFSIGLAWAFWGEVDIVVSAPGKVIPSGQVKTVQAPEAGSVLEIHVSEGESVKAGQLLVSMDPAYASADNERWRSELRNAEVELNWRHAFERWLDDTSQESGLPGEVDSLTPSDRSKATRLLVQHQREYSTTVGAFEGELVANLSEQAAIQAEVARTRASLAVLNERTEAYKALVDKQYGARVQYLELLQQQTDMEKSLPVLESNHEKLASTARAISERFEAAKNEIHLRNTAAIYNLQREIETLQQESYKAIERERRLDIHASVDGTVQELSVHTIGEVVNTGQELMKLVPKNAKVIVQALVQNKDIGFLSENQQATVKVEAFNFTKYGLLDGRIVTISRDSIENENYGWVFRVALELQSDKLQVNERTVSISPGMAVTAEVKTGKRKLIEFVLAPLIRYRSESVRER